ADILEIDPSTISEGDSFTDDLEADSLALIELAEALEEEIGERSVGFRFEGEDLEDIKTVRDAVEYVLARVCGTVLPVPVDHLDELARRLGVELDDPEVLAPALVHRSWCAENPGHESNERLEFLGDAVLGLIITDHAFHAYPDLSEGELTDVRKAVVNAVTLAEVADELGLGEYLLLGKGEEQSGGREKPSILADALEAVLGAVYVAAGMEEAHALV